MRRLQDQSNEAAESASSFAWTRDTLPPSRTGEFLLRLVEALQAVSDRAASTVTQPRREDAKQKPSNTAEAATTSAAVVVEVKEAGSRNDGCAEDAEEDEQREVVLTMEDLVLEPPALASGVSGHVVPTSEEQSRVPADRKRCTERKGSTAGTTVTTAAAGSAEPEVERHLDHVLEALVRAKAIAMPRSRFVLVLNAEVVLSWKFVRFISG